MMCVLGAIVYASSIVNCHHQRILMGRMQWETAREVERAVSNDAGAGTWLRDGLEPGCELGKEQEASRDG